MSDQDKTAFCIARAGLLAHPQKIRLLANNPRPDGALKLKGIEAEYCIRIGDYRLRYKIDDDNQVVILGDVRALIIVSATQAKQLSPQDAAALIEQDYKAK